MFYSNSALLKLFHLSGTGASCIYPLLGCATRSEWSFIATEIDQFSFNKARENVSLNDLSNRINVSHVNENDPIIPLDGFAKDRIHFTMCNPPFFSSTKEMQAGTAFKKQPPATVCTGSEQEMIYPDGGEFGFVSRIIEESLNLKDRVRWYTSLLGKLQSVRAIITKIKELGVNNWAVCCIETGSKTKRWAVAWSFTDRRPEAVGSYFMNFFKDNVRKIADHNKEVSRRNITTKELLPPNTEHFISLQGCEPFKPVTKLKQFFDTLEMKWDWNAASTTGTGSAFGKVWSREARRKRLRETPYRVNRSETGDYSVSDPAIFICKLTIGKGGINVRWLRGIDFVLFESFTATVVAIISGKLS